MKPTKANDDELNLILREFGFEAQMLEVRISSGDSEPTESINVRVVMPSTPTGGESSMLQLLRTPWTARGNPAMHLHAIRLLKLLPIAEDPRRLHARVLGPKGLFHTPSIREAWKLLKIEWSLPSVVRALGQLPEASDEELVENALYTERLELSLSGGLPSPMSRLLPGQDVRHASQCSGSR